MIQTIKNKVVHSELSYKINGILYQVRKDLGVSKNEKQYCDAIETKLKAASIQYEREKIAPESFKDEIKGRNRVDFIIENKIILEIKAKPFITKDDYYQTLRYLEAFNSQLAIITNMRKYYVHPKRILNPKYKESSFA